MLNFCHLHAHSTYSILDAWGTPEQIVERLLEAELPAHALTDHDSTSGHWKFSKEMLGAGLKPIFGIEIRVVDNLEQREWKSPEGRRFYPYHLGLLARNQEGYKNLINLTSLAWSQGMGGRGKYMPVVTWDDLRKSSSGLYATSGCLSGKLSRAILGQVEDDWQDVLEMMTDCFEPDSLLIEWQNIGLDAVSEVSETLAPLLNTVVTHDVHFPWQSKRDAQNIMAAIMRWKKVVGPDGQGPMHEDCYLASANDVYEIGTARGVVTPKDLSRAMERSWEVAESISVTLPKIEPVRFPVDGNSVAYFKNLINVGWHKRGLDKLPKAERKVYIDRVRYEVDVITKKDFVDYFLIIADICQFCIEVDILKGPARGSSAGSLVAWCLEITEVNPIEHGLIFERFIGLEREELPDIDMDFPDNRREEIHNYLETKYGRDRIGYIGTFTAFKAKNALDDVARVFELPYWVTSKIKPYIPERAHGDVRGQFTLQDSLDDFEEVREIVNKYPDIRKAIDLEGQFRGMGVHPAGFVVSSVPIEDVAPIYQQAEKGRVVGLDMYDAAEAGLLKIDLLGLKTMTVLTHARDAVRDRHGVDVDFYNLPLDDKETMEGFASGDVLGMFQFGGKATKNVLRQIKPRDFHTLVDVNTLSRPGSMLAGTSDLYVAVHQGKADPASIHPIVDEITADTHNLVLYQEQVLRIMRDFGGLSWKQAGEIRKDISKRVGIDKLQRFREDFISGAAAKGVDEQTAYEVWMMTSTFGAYGFNKSHSVAYSLIAYWQMYTKRHYPIEFYFASLAAERDQDKRNLFVNEAKRRGVSFLPVSPNRSTKTFSLEEDGIRYGLTQISGIGDKTADLMIEARPFKGWEDVLAVKGIGAKTIEVMRESWGKGGDLFGLEAKSETLRNSRHSTSSISVSDLIDVVDKGYINTSREHFVSGHVISRNYRQEEKLSVQAKSSSRVGVKSDTVIVYIRDELGESFPVVIPGWLGSRKTREIWEGEDNDIYVIRGRLPKHGKFYLATGLANTDYQRRLQKGRNKQLSLGNFE